MPSCNGGQEDAGITKTSQPTSTIHTIFISLREKHDYYSKNVCYHSHGSACVYEDLFSQRILTNNIIYCI